MDLEVDENQQKQVHKDEDTQKELNAPISDPTGVDKKDEEFFEIVSGLVKDGKINLYQPSTLLNKPVYEKLSEDAQGKIDLKAINLLAALRQIMDLSEAGFSDSYQIQNQVEAFRHTKRRAEEESGDVFII
ncbi:hypothetical protein HON58_01645 [Candidatus Peregrinibacteria bacterium]|jgi:hypothetical protein|nr:hypothetical protein [Candidatus Peregrinibacteria bacterium]